jgi:hypothetical protein
MRRVMLHLSSTALAPVCWTQAPPPAGGWVIDVIGGPVSPSNPEVTIRMSAWWDDGGDPTWFAFWRGDFDLLGDPSGGFAGPRLLLVSNPPQPQPPNASAGTPSGGDILGVFVEQNHHQFGPWANPANPMPLWESEWTTSDFTPRTIDLATSNTTTFDIYCCFPWGTGAPNHTPRAIIPGSAKITVVPAPASAFLALAAALPLVRRRRGRAAPVRSRGEGTGVRRFLWYT